MLMFSLPAANWWRLFVWLALGLVIYFVYGYTHSELRKREEIASRQVDRGDADPFVPRNDALGHVLHARSSP